MIAGLWASLVLIVVSGIFGYHAWLGWQTQIVRFPLSVLTLEPFDRDRRPANFWGVLIVDSALAGGALAAALFLAADALFVTARPIYAITTLDGCYEGEGLPDFMRPRRHWEFRITRGVVSDVFGKPISRVSLGAATPKKTMIAFHPGIGSYTDKSRGIFTFTAGDAVAGTAYQRDDRTIITLSNDWGDVLLRTNCG